VLLVMMVFAIVGALLGSCVYVLATLDPFAFEYSRDPATDLRRIAITLIAFPATGSVVLGIVRWKLPGWLAPSARAASLGRHS
jgi:hypothetical protein